MIKTVTFEQSTWNDLPKFEAGTPNIAAIGMGAAKGSRPPAAMTTTTSGPS